MDVSLFYSIINFASVILVVYFSAASIALLSLLFCIGKNNGKQKYDCMAIFLPLLAWLLVAFTHFVRKPMADFGALVILGCTVSVLSVVRVLAGYKIKYAAQAYLLLVLVATIYVLIFYPAG